MHENILNFNSVVGEGSVIKIAPLVQPTIENASLIRKNMLIVNKEQSCDVISLASKEKVIVAVAVCKSGSLLLCPGGVNECNNKYLSPAKLVADNKLVMRSSFSKRRYVVEFYEDKLIYRIQDKNCFIKYPHGCLIYGFGWHDQYTYEFTR